MSAGTDEDLFSGEKPLKNKDQEALQSQFAIKMTAPEVLVPRKHVSIIDVLLILVSLGCFLIDTITGAFKLSFELYKSTSEGRSEDSSLLHFFVSVKLRTSSLLHMYN